MSHVGLAIDPSTNDVYLTATGNLAMVYDAEAVGQHVRQRLKFFQNDWFLDTTAGIPWLQQVLGESYNPSLADALVKAEIMGTSGVTAINSLSVSYERYTRGLSINEVEVSTIYEEDSL